MSQKFKQTEIGMIPEDWKIVEFMEILSEKTRNGIYKQKQFHGSGTKIINMKELFAYSRIGNQDMKRIRLNQSEKSRFLVQTGDLLFARRSLVAEGSGKCLLIVEHSEEITFESSIILARPNKKIVDPEFLFYLFLSPVGRYIMGTILRQVAVSGITGTDLMKLKIMCPPLSEQSAITKILLDLDFKIKLNQEMNKTLEEIGKSLFKHWFIDFEFPNEEGKPYKSSNGDLVFNEDLEKDVPRDWNVEKLGDHFDFIKGKKPLDTSEVFIENYLPQILIENLDGKTPLFGNPAKIITVEKTEPIMVMDGASSGRIEVGHKGILGSTLAKIVSNNTLTNIYIYYFLKMRENDINNNTTGTSIPHTDKEKVRSYRTIIPDKNILDTFDKFIYPIFQKIILNKNEIHSLIEIRDSLLSKLISGKIRVPAEVRK